MNRSVFVQALGLGVLLALFCGKHAMADAPEVKSPVDESWPVGEFAQRVGQSPQLLSGVNRLSPGGRNAFRDLSEAGDKIGRMLTYREFMDQLSQTPVNITQDDFSSLFWTFSRAQQPQLLNAELATIVQGWNNDIRSLDLEYTVAFDGGYHDGIVSSNHFMLDGVKMLWDKTVLTPAPGEPVERDVLSYDGSVFRNARTFGREDVDQWDSGRNVMGRIQPLDTPVRFYDRQNPFVLAGLLDQKRRFDSIENGLGTFITDSTLFESTEVINGLNCRCVANEIRSFYFSLDHAMALVAVREGHYDFNTDLGRVVTTNTYSEQDNRDLVVSDTGIWIPQNINIKLVRGADTERIEVEVKKSVVNEKIAATSFTDIIPPGSLVTDPSHPVARHLAPPGVIEDDLDLTPQPKSSGMSLLIWVNALCLSLIVAYFVTKSVLKRRSNKPL